MGNMCGTDIYKQIKEKYKSQFIKYIVSEKAKQYVNQQSTNAKKTVVSKIADIKADKIKQINLKKEMMDQHYSQVRTRIDKKYPGGVVSLQSVKKAKLQDLLGYKFYLSKFKQLRIETDQKFQEQAHQILSEIDQIQAYHIRKFEQQTPNLVLYKQLSPQIQRNVFKQGEQEYNNQIQHQKINFKKSLGDKFDSDYYIRRIVNILPQESLQGLVSLSKDKFQTTGILLVGGSFDGVQNILQQKK